MSLRARTGDAQAQPVESPCTGVCVIDERSGLCEGCLRTLAEVATWGSSTTSRRREILAAVARRRLDESPSAG